MKAEVILVLKTNEYLQSEKRVKEVKGRKRKLQQEIDEKMHEKKRQEKPIEKAKKVKFCETCGQEIKEYF